ncbi:hypothetical protein HS99_0022470 [Kitasatospora aureofaciens]|uniref:Uncharacterized protein n=1 Tax=Kitasatospora aureofaciens TaxID=1894 RepID=A0A1E7NC92_KITAU|nr:hypothetical protein B6264_15800 [Kitasatospora aureofaciens]OEV38302.1 hypothetical protein HS99_0022470 [Kitasatospora aureofaciens]
MMLAARVSMEAWKESLVVPSQLVAASVLTLVRVLRISLRVVAALRHGSPAAITAPGSSACAILRRSAWLYLVKSV